MLMILGFFGALVAGAAADTMLGMRTNPDQDDDDPQESENNEHMRVETEATFLAFFDDPTGNDLPPQDVPAKFDGLAERIHSSDAYDPPAPPDPVVAIGGNTPDALNGAALNDWLTGGSAETFLAGHGGDDLLQAGSAATHQIGGEGDDTLWGGVADDRLEGGEGNDLLIAGAGSNVLMGGAGDDILVGHNPFAVGPDPAHANFLNGGAGDDVLIAGTGDYLNGGTGSDVFGLGDWLQQGPVVSITDFQAHEDQILLHYDPARVASPEVEIRFDGNDTDTAQIWLNGHWIAQVAQAPDLTAADIGLVPLTGPSLGA